jgi:hypothetical protein
MMCEPLTGDRGEELLTSYRAGFRARTSVPQERAPELTASEAASGPKWQGSLARYDRVSRSWKTRQCLLFEDLAECLETWPKWGTTRDGAAYRQPTPYLLLEIRQRITGANESGSRLPTPRSQEPGRTSEGYGRGLAELVEGNEQIPRLPTPMSRDWKGPPGAGCVARGGRQSSLPSAVMKLGTQTATSRPRSGKFVTNAKTPAEIASQIGGKLNPQWVEWLMGWPIGWTDLSALETDKFRMWQS